MQPFPISWKEGFPRRHRGASGLVLLLILGIVAAACGDATSTTSDPNGGGDTTTSTGDSLPFEGRAISVIAHAGHDLYMPTVVIPAFEAATGATVEYISIPGGDLTTRWTTMAAAQDGSIDVLYGNAVHAATFAGSGLYEDLTPLVDPDIVAGMVEASLQASTWDGGIWYLAMDSLGWQFLWNTEMYEEAGLDPTQAPETFDDYINASVALTSGDRYGTHLPMNFFSYLMLYNSTGAELLSDDGRTLYADSDESLLVLDAMKRLVDSGALTPASYASDVTFDAGEGFRTEQIAHYIGASSHYPRSQNPELSTTVGKVAVGLIPGLVLRSGSTTGNEGFGINAYSENKDVALAFVEFTHTDEMQRYIALEWGRGPGQQRFVDDPTLLDDNLAENQPHIAAMLEQSQFPSRRYQAPFHFDLDRVFTEHILRLANGQASIEETAETLQSLGQEIVDRYWADR